MTIAADQNRDTITVLDNGNILITIFGKPQAKPRMTRRDKWAKRKCVLEYRDWCDRVRADAKSKIPPTDSILELNWRAYFVPAPSWSKKRRLAAMGQLHRQTPDRDNIDKAVLDCLFEDDSGVADGRIKKRWDWKARIEIEIVVVERK